MTLLCPTMFAIHNAIFATMARFFLCPLLPLLAFARTVSCILLVSTLPTCWWHLVHMLFLNTHAVPHGPLSGRLAANAATKPCNKHGMSHAESCNLCTSGQAWYTPPTGYLNHLPPLPPTPTITADRRTLPLYLTQRLRCLRSLGAFVESTLLRLAVRAVRGPLSCGGGALAHVSRLAQLRRGRLRVLRLRGASSSVASESAAVWVSSLTVASSSSSPSSPARAGAGGKQRGG